MLDYVNNGFMILKSLVSTDEAKYISNMIYHIIKQYALELDTTVEQYLYCTGRWADPSLTTSVIPNSLKQKIALKIEKVTQQKVFLKKQNVIVKCTSIKDEVPFHQDISYSYDSPYDLSVWLSLNNVDDQNGPLQIIAKSHHWPIQSAIDFWSPKFVDHVRLKHQDAITEIHLNAGDAIIFDSRLWHGSKLKSSDDDRFAYVTRWNLKYTGYSDIPLPKLSNFGMWNCDKITNDLLQYNLKTICNKNIFLENIDSTKLLEFCSDNIHNSIFSETLNTKTVVQDLKNLITLKQAFSKHNAGDLAGKIYKNLWNSLLQYLITET